MSTRQPVVTALTQLIAERPDLSAALLASITAARRPGIADIDSYYAFLDDMVTLIPADRTLNRLLNKFFYLVDQSPDGILKTDASFQRWMHRFCEDWGAFLDTPESAADIAGFFPDPAYHISDYYVAPSGWLTFNQFFARQVRPGRRPIDGLRDDVSVVCPADSVYQGQWTIGADSRITVKGLTWSVLDLLEGSPFKHRFVGGLFTHSFLNVNDYHRFHTPVAGQVKEARKITGRIMMDVIALPDGSLDTVDGTGYQFKQDRGLLVLDSPVGLVAILPIGMAQVSSVTLTAEVGANLYKGQEFGFFMFGGSDIVMLFEATKVQLDASVGTHYNQGRQIGRAALS